MKKFQSKNYSFLLNSKELHFHKSEVKCLEVIKAFAFQFQSNISLVKSFIKAYNSTLYYSTEDNCKQILGK